MCQFHSKIFIVRVVSAIRPSSVTDNLRERYQNISGYDMVQLNLKLPVTDDGLTAETAPTMNIFCGIGT